MSNHLLLYARPWYGQNECKTWLEMQQNKVTEFFYLNFSKKDGSRKWALYESWCKRERWRHLHLLATLYVPWYDDNFCYVLTHRWLILFFALTLVSDVLKLFA